MKKIRFLRTIAAIVLLLSAQAFSVAPHQRWLLNLPSPAGATYWIRTDYPNGPFWPDGKGGCAIQVDYFSDAGYTLIKTRVFWITSKEQVRMVEFPPNSNVSIFRVTASALYLLTPEGAVKVTSDPKGNVTSVPFGNSTDYYQAGSPNDTLGFFSTKPGEVSPVPATVTRWTN